MLPHKSRVIEGHRQESTPPAWGNPRPLDEPESQIPDYPTEFLGEILGAAVREIAPTIGAAVPVVAQAILSAATLAAQGVADVVLDGRKIPLHNYYITIAESGERKTEADRVALQEHRKYQDEAIAAVISTDPGGQGVLAELLLSDVSYAGVVEHLLIGRPSAGLFTDEAGTFIGGPAMRAEYQAMTQAGLSSLWSSGNLSAPRRSKSRSLDRSGIRLSAHILSTPSVATRILSDEGMWEQGIFARCLMVSAKSLAGSRRYVSVDVTKTVAVLQFHRQVRALLERPLRISPLPQCGLDLPAITLSPFAKKVWEKFFAESEMHLSPQGDLVPIKGMASRASEQVLRLAGVLTLVNDPSSSTILPETVESAVELVRYYLRQGLVIHNKEVRQKGNFIASKLLEWFKSQSADRPVSHTTVLQYSPCRKATTAESAIQILVENGWVRKKTVNRATSYEVWRGK